MHRGVVAALVISSVVLLTSCVSGEQPSAAGASYRAARPAAAPIPPWTPGPDWTLTWSDNFTGPGSLRGWKMDTGGNGWSHEELQNYSPGSVALKPGGGLVITASKNGNGAQCWYGPCKYTSALIKTEGFFQQEYGLFSAYIRIPTGRGIWPAFWMEGANSLDAPWPYDGEIDVIEVNNQKPGLVEASVHAPTINHGSYLQLSTSLSASYHVYSVEWTPKGITWLIDGHAYGHVTTKGAPFNQPFFLLLDVAVGGTWPGSPTASTKFPAQMDVSWIHVYKQKQTG